MNASWMKGRVQNAGASPTTNLFPSPRKGNKRKKPHLLAFQGVDSCILRPDAGLEILQQIPYSSGIPYQGKGIKISERVKNRGLIK